MWKIKKEFNKEDYNLFSNLRLNEIGENLYVRNLNNIDRKEFIKRLQQITENPNSLKFRLMNIEINYWYKLNQIKKVKWI